jgi:hypothetical protein
MLSNEEHPTDSWDERSTQGTAIYVPLANIFLVVVVLFFLLAEAVSIHALWFASKQPLSFLKRCGMPLFILVPFTCGFAMYTEIRSMLKLGQISFSNGTRLRFHLAFVSAMAYMAIMELVNVSYP